MYTEISLLAFPGISPASGESWGDAFCPPPFDLPGSEPRATQVIVTLSHAGKVIMLIHGQHGMHTLFLYQLRVPHWFNFIIKYHSNER